MTSSRMRYLELAEELTALCEVGVDRVVLLAEGLCQTLNF